MTARPRPSPATYDDIVALPPNVVGELIDGVLHTHPRPAFPHAAATTALTGELGPPFGRGRGGPGGWILLIEPELHFDGDVLVPDLASWRRERMPTMPDTAFTTLAPDWTCEVLSPSTHKVDRGEKLRVYARERVGHVWLVDPIERYVEVLRLDGETYRIVATHTDDAKARLEPFDAIELDLAIL